jgi:hypothetical protein
MSTTIIDSPAVPPWKQKHEQSQRRSAAALKAAATREANRKEAARLEREQEARREYLYETLLTEADREAIDLALGLIRRTFESDFENWFKGREQAAAKAIAEIVAGVNHTKHARTLIKVALGYFYPVMAVRGSINLGDILDEQMLDSDENEDIGRDDEDVKGMPEPGETSPNGVTLNACKAEEGTTT